MADMEDRVVFAFLKALKTPPIRWKVTGPGGKRYRVISQTDRDIANDFKSGVVEFVIEPTKADGTVEPTITMTGSMNADGTETIKKDGVTLPEPNVDFGIAGTGSISLNPRSVRGSVIVKFEWKDDSDADGRPDFRFEGRV